jgi:Protein of unknown function DUF84
MQRSIYTMFENNPKITIALGSTCKSKIRGVESVFVSAFVKSCDVLLETGQPLSKKQTEEFAIKRATEAQRIFPECDLFVGIQNGIWPMDQTKNSVECSSPETPLSYENLWDGACIHIFGKNLQPVSIWTREVMVISFLQKGRKGEWSSYEDPHLLVSNRPRAYFIEEALRTFVESFFFKAIGLHQQKQ